MAIKRKTAAPNYFSTKAISRTIVDGLKKVSYQNPVHAGYLVWYYLPANRKYN